MDDAINLTAYRLQNTALLCTINHINSKEKTTNQPATLRTPVSIIAGFARVTKLPKPSVPELKILPDTVVSRCFVGCLRQACKRCSNRCCCGIRNYASDVRPTDPLAAGVKSQCQTLAPGVIFCISTARPKYIFF